MHYLDLDLFYYQIKYTHELLKYIQGNSLNDEIDRRLSEIPRFPGLKIFSHGIQSISRFTADDYKNLMKVMVFVIDNLYNDESFINNKELIILYQEWNEMYMMSRYEKFGESDLEKFKVKILFLIFNKTTKFFKNLYNNLGNYNYLGKTIYRNISIIFSIRIKTPEITFMDISYNSINT